MRFKSICCFDYFLEGEILLQEDMIYNISIVTLPGNIIYYYIFENDESKYPICNLLEYKFNSYFFTKQEMRHINLNKILQ